MNAKTLPTLVILSALFWIGCGPTAQTEESFLSCKSSSQALPYHPGWKSLEKALGRVGTQRDDMLKLSFPRTDLNIVVNGLPLDPAMALTTWFAFKHLSKGTLMMGEMVLLDQEVPKVLAQLNLCEGVEVNGLEHPLLDESPGIETLRLSGRGSLHHLAEIVRSILSVTNTPSELSPLQTNGPQRTPSRGSLPRNPTDPSWLKVEEVLGQGETQGEIVEYGFPAPSFKTKDGVEIPPFMGMEAYARIQKNGPWIAVAGKLVLTAAQVKPLTGVLAGYKITLTALSGPTLEGSPQIFFLYFWVMDKPEPIALGLKAILESLKGSPS